MGSLWGICCAQEDSKLANRAGRHSTSDRDLTKKGKPTTVVVCLPFDKNAAFRDAYFFPFDPNNSPPHFFAVAAISSLEDSATGGKSFIHSYGRVASMIARELKPFLPT